MKITRFMPQILLLAMFVWIAGCATSDPLAGWYFCFSQDPAKLDKAIQVDYQNYIQKLPENERISIGPIDLLEDGTGQHAIRIPIALNGTDWAHVLIYDKDNKRIKVIKYATGHYAS